ncbi:MAG: hypothetical protein Q8P91_03850 [bacterium]|nr:hypothetical protein [bacterium]
MSYKESPIQTTLSFIPSWEAQNLKRIAVELVSLHQETNRKPDTYYFELNNEKLSDPETARPILSFISPGVEYKIAEDLQSWVSQNDEGLAFWISPALDGKYPCSKAIIHKIAYNLEGKKVLLNSAILFDAFLEHPEELRRNLFTTQDSEENVSAILQWIEKVSKQKPKKADASPKIRQQAEYFAQKIALGIHPHSIVGEMQQAGFLGQNSISCSGGGLLFSGYTLGHSNINNQSELCKFVRNCGKCRVAINSIISKGYRCPKCGGVYEGC